MQQLIIFIIGTIFVILVLPILQAIADVILTLSQRIISSLNVKTIENNVAIQEMQNSIESNSNAIGFQMPDEQIEYYDDDDEEYETEDKIKQKAGFII